MRYALCLFVLMVSAPATGADYLWQFDPVHADRGFAVSGDCGLIVQGAPGNDAHGGGYILDGVTQELRTVEPIERPVGPFTVSAWVSIDTPERWGGIVSCVQDNNDAERGWVLGYDNEYFTFGLASAGADDGNGLMTYLAADRPYEIGRWHSVVASYDGAVMRIYVDGRLAGQSETQRGDVLDATDTPFVIGAYRDSNEFHPHDGRLAAVSLRTGAVDPDRAASDWHARHAHLSTLEPWVDTKLEWLVDPFLTWPTTEAMSVTFETTLPTTATIEWWRDDGSDRRSAELSRSMLHQHRLRALQPDAKYFYRVTARASGEALESSLLSFRTAASLDRAFTFVVIGDTQSQAEVVRRVSDLAYMHRPNLLVHAGDLVSTGSDKSHWTDHFFPNMQPLIGRVPLMPVLGNHEQDARLYYDYMDLPQPERWYSFTFGDAEFFMIDGNRALDDQSDQLAWLSQSLAASTARWKFAVLHQPPYTSDSDDYGDTFETTSRRGDMNVRNIVKLLEKHEVDICFSGHVHDYERTFPIREGRVTPYDEGGVVYVTAAGGGGHLENFDPANTWFGHKKAHYHHLVYVAIHDDILEFQAIDEHGRLFDVFELRKDGGARRRIDRHSHGHDHE